MVDLAAFLRTSGFDLDTAVTLAQASAAAYWPANKVASWAQGEGGFNKSKFFDSGSVQGYWCTAGDVALLAFRGTSNPGQWLRDARFFPARHDWGRVHIGFRNGVAELERELAEFDDIASAAKHVWLTGHSLGGALAVIAAARLKMKKGISAFLHTYGQPALGLNSFAERFSVEMPSRLWRFVNQSDIVTRVPPLPYRHTGIVKRIVRPSILQAATRASAAPPTAAAAVFKAATAGGATLEAATELAAAAATFEEVIAGGAALESANAVVAAGLGQPQFIELDALPLTELEFSSLQFALGAAAPPEARGPALEGAIPFIADHAIGDYIQLLKDIRDAAGRVRPAA